MSNVSKIDVKKWRCAAKCSASFVSMCQFIFTRPSSPPLLKSASNFVQIIYRVYFVMDDLDGEEVVMQHMANVNNIACNFKLNVFYDAVLSIEKRLICFSGMTIDARVLCRHMETAKASLQPALKLRQIVNVETCSRSMKMTIDRMTYELNVVSVRKKCTLFQIVSDFRMLRHLI